MAWNAALPGTSEKLRDISSVITQNWDEIEQGPDASGAATALEFHSIQLGDRSTIAASGDPITDAGIFYQYAKNDGTNIEYFTKAPDGAIVQMSKGDVTSAASGTTYLPGGILLQWGRSGSVGGTSNATITFNQAFTTAVYSVTVTGNPAVSGDQDWSVVGTPITASFVMRNGTGTAMNAFWMAIGS